MRTGVTLPFEHLRLTDLPVHLQRAEALGYEEAWSYERNVFDAFTPLAAAAMVTRTLRLGTSIVPAFTRPDGLLAMSAAGVAELAPGRFALGIGSSTEAIVNGWMGLHFGRPLTRVREAVLTTRALLDGERVGKLRLDRPPAEPPPIYVAALGERMLRLAGETADGVVFFMAGARAIPELVASTGRPLDSVARVIVVSGRDHAANLAFARRFVTGYAVLPFYARFLSAQGWERAVERIRARWDAGDRQGATLEVPEEMAQELLLLATDPRLEDRLGAFEQSGLGVIDLWFMSSAEDADVRRMDVERALVTFAPAAEPARVAGGE